ncbi:unnamed protein product, partial [Phaeothamnion confervicola]
IGVRATFSLRGVKPHAFASEPKQSEAAPPATGRYDYAYTGRHDDGSLPPPKTGGPHGILLRAL